MDVYGLSDKGLRRELNEDSYIYEVNKRGDLLVCVCDGIGGSAAAHKPGHAHIAQKAEHTRNKGKAAQKSRRARDAARIPGAVLGRASSARRGGFTTFAVRAAAFRSAHYSSFQPCKKSGQRTAGQFWGRLSKHVKASCLQQTFPLPAALGF